MDAYFHLWKKLVCRNTPFSVVFRVFFGREETRPPTQRIMYNRLPIEPHGIGIVGIVYANSNYFPSGSNAGTPIPISLPSGSNAGAPKFRKVGWFCTIIQCELGYPNSQAGHASACSNGFTQDIIPWWNLPSTVCSLVLKAGNVVGTLETGEGNSTESTDHTTGWFCSIKTVWNKLNWPDLTLTSRVQAINSWFCQRTSGHKSCNLLMVPCCRIGSNCCWLCFSMKNMSIFLI